MGASTLTHKHFLPCGSSGAHASQSAFSKKGHLHRRISCRTHGLTAYLFLLPHSTPSLLDPSNRSIPCHPQQGLSFGRFAEQSPLTVQLKCGVGKRQPFFGEEEAKMKVKSMEIGKHKESSSSGQW